MKNNYKFTDKIHPISAIIAFVVSIAVFIGLVLLCIRSSESGGNGSLLYGVAGIVGMFVSLAGFIVSVLCMKRQDIFYRFPALGATTNGVLFLSLFVLYILGMGI